MVEILVVVLLFTVLANVSMAVGLIAWDLLRYIVAPLAVVAGVILLGMYEPEILKGIGAVVVLISVVGGSAYTLYTSFMEGYRSDEVADVIADATPTEVHEPKIKNHHRYGGSRYGRG